MRNEVRCKGSLHVASVAGRDTANAGGERNRRSGSSRRSAGNGGLGQSTGSEGDKGSSVLHFEYGGRVMQLNLYERTKTRVNYTSIEY